jgi:hypothetical protein
VKAIGRSNTDRTTELIIQILTGISLVVCSVVIETAAIAVAIATLKRYSEQLSGGMHLGKTTFLLSCVTLWILASLFIAMLLWAVTFRALGLFDSLEQAMYFSTITFTTVGYGDSTLPEEWRQLSGILGANGLILFSLSTAFLFEVFRRLLGNPQEKEG